MIKSLKFNNKHKQISHPLTNHQSQSKENQAEETLKLLSQVSHESINNYKSYGFKEQTVSPWVSINCQETDPLKPIRQENTRTRQRNRKVREKKRPLKQCLSSLNNYENKVNFDSVLNELPVQLKRQISQPIRQKPKQKPNKQLKWQLREGNDECSGLKKKIIQNIEKQSIISMYKFKNQLKYCGSYLKPKNKQILHRTTKKASTDQPYKIIFQKMNTYDINIF